MSRVGYVSISCVFKGGVLTLIWRRYRKPRKTKNVEPVSGPNFELDTD